MSDINNIYYKLQTFQTIIISQIMMSVMYLLSFIITTYSQQVFEDHLYCGSHTTGSTTQAYDINYYQFTLSGANNVPFTVVFDTCGSSYDTWLHLHHLNWTTIDSCDDCGDCATRTIMTIDDLYNGTYILGVGGYSTRYGSYRLTINCSSEHDTPSPIDSTSSEITPSPIESWPIEDDLTCDKTVDGYTSFARDINYYLINVTTTNDKEYTAIFKSCGSDYDTHLYIYDENGNIIESCDDCGDCGTRTIIESQLTTNQQYILGIGGYRSHHGNYTVHMSCIDVEEHSVSVAVVIIVAVIPIIAICGCIVLCGYCCRSGSREQRDGINNNRNPPNQPQPIPMKRIVAPNGAEGVISGPRSQHFMPQQIAQQFVYPAYQPQQNTINYPANNAQSIHQSPINPMHINPIQINPMQINQAQVNRLQANPLQASPLQASPLQAYQYEINDAPPPAYYSEGL